MSSPDYNPYAAPTETPAYDFAKPVGGGDYVLATLSQRFVGNLLDSLLFAVPIVCAAIPIGMLEARSSGDSDTVLVLVGVVAGLVLLALTGVQWFMISTSGQSIGKRLVKTKIVRLDGSNPGFVYGVVVRGIVGHLPGFVPLFGHLYNLVDTICIFQEERRTLRDLIAGTRVIQVLAWSPDRDGGS